MCWFCIIFYWEFTLKVKRHRLLAKCPEIKVLLGPDIPLIFKKDPFFLTPDVNKRHDLYLAYYVTKEIPLFGQWGRGCYYVKKCHSDFTEKNRKLAQAKKWPFLLTQRGGTNVLPPFWEWTFWCCSAGGLKNGFLKSTFCVQSRAGEGRGSVEIVFFRGASFWQKSLGSSWICPLLNPLKWYIIWPFLSGYCDHPLLDSSIEKKWKSKS